MENFFFFLNKQHLDKSLFSLMPFFISLRRIFGHPLGYWEPRPLKIYQSGLFTSNIVKENGELQFVYLQCLTKNTVMLTLLIFDQTLIFAFFFYR